ncbi:Hypothetical_protein [Hexamita inflata]|uniref:Hypothetical_protein n=1 Tax=Hexamita inflata TaxID=28002 RepID=A0AA86U4M9_9EUKA|nr:Hypothetical protein HINF_LOCUS28289 [Hexamita inflata]
MHLYTTITTTTTIPYFQSNTQPQAPAPPTPGRSSPRRPQFPAGQAYRGHAGGVAGGAGVVAGGAGVVPGGGRGGRGGGRGDRRHWTTTTTDHLWDGNPGVKVMAWVRVSCVWFGCEGDGWGSCESSDTGEEVMVEGRESHGDGGGTKEWEQWRDESDGDGQEREKERMKYYGTRNGIQRIESNRGNREEIEIRQEVLKQQSKTKWCFGQRTRTKHGIEAPGCTWCTGK